MAPIVKSGLEELDAACGKLEKLLDKAPAKDAKRITAELECIYLASDVLRQLACLLKCN